MLQWKWWSEYTDNFPVPVKYLCVRRLMWHLWIDRSVLFAIFSCAVGGTITCSYIIETIELSTTIITLISSLQHCKTNYKLKIACSSQVGKYRACDKHKIRNEKSFVQEIYILSNLLACTSTLTKHCRKIRKTFLQLLRVILNYLQRIAYSETAQLRASVSNTKWNLPFVHLFKTIGYTFIVAKWNLHIVVIT